MYRVTTGNVEYVTRPVPVIFLLISAGIALLSVLAVLLWSVHESISRANYWGSQVDQFLFLNSISPDYPNVWLNITQLGDAIVLIPLLSFLTVFRPQMWAALFGAVPVSVLLANGGKAIASIPRPATVLDHKLFSIVGDPLTAYNSIPSGHTITIFAATTAIVVILLLAPRRFGGLWIFLGGLMIASTVAFSRVAVGAHWPLDIVVGAAFGCLGGISGVVLTQRFELWWTWMRNSAYQWILSLVLLGWSAALVGDPISDTLPIAWIAATTGAATATYLLVRNLRHR